MRPILIALSIVASACSALAQSGDIAFLSGTEQEDQCVSLLDLETETIQRVGPGARDGAPRWSPDGRYLGFESKQKNGLGIYLVAADGQAGRFVNQRFAWNHRPRWDAAGKRLVYSSDNAMAMQQQLVVYSLESDSEEIWGGSEHLGMLRPIWMPTLDLMQALSPDADLSWEGVDTPLLLKEAQESGALLAIGLVGKAQALSTEIFLVTRSQRIPLLPLIQEDTARYVEWGVEMNHKGRSIAFESNCGGDREIFVINKYGLTNISNHRAADWNPVWSPDGYWVAFESFRGGRRGIYTSFSRTNRVNSLAASPQWDAWAPSWSPDKEWLVYVSNEHGAPELYCCDAKGTRRRRLTQNNIVDLAPAWRPKVKQ